MNKINLMNNKKLGDHGEDIACIYLRGKGHTILSRNYTCKLGEIDIISKFQERLFISEVKTRRSDKFGSPYESVDYHKMNKIYSSYDYYCMERNIEDYDSVFQIISILIDKESEIRIDCFEEAWG